MGTKSCAKILNFSTTFSCENLAVEDFVTLFMGKKKCWWGNAFFGHGFDKLVYALLCGGQEDDICKSRQSCSSTVQLPVKHRHQHMYSFYPRSHLSVDEHKRSPARMRYSNHFCTLRTELQADAAPMLLWFTDSKIPRLLNSLYRGREVHLD